MSEFRINWNEQFFIKILEAITLTAVVCLTISEFGGYYLIITTIGKHSRLLMRSAFALFVIKILLTRYTKKEFLGALLLSVLGYLNYEISGNDEIMMSLAFVLSMKNVKLKKVFQACFYSVTFMVLLLGSLSILGIAGELEITKEYGRGVVETRYCFGFFHPNQWSHAVFMCFLYAMLAFWEKMNWKYAVVIMVINLVVFKFSDSRASLMCTTLMLVFMLFFKYVKNANYHKAFSWLMLPCVAGVWAGSVFVMSDHGIAQWIREKFDLFFTRRLSFAKLYVEEYPMSIFGKQIPAGLKYGQPLDFGYIRFLLENGMLIYLLMLSVSFALCIYVAKRRRYDVLIALVCITIYGVYENIAICSVPANVVMIYGSLLLFSERTGRNGEKVVKD